MSNDNIDVRYVANLARIEINDEEVATFQGQLEAILGYIETLKDVNVDGIDLTTHTDPNNHSLREDVSRQNLGQSDLIQNAPDNDLGQIRVPKVVDA